MILRSTLKIFVWLILALGMSSGMGCSVFTPPPTATSTATTTPTETPIPTATPSRTPLPPTQTPTEVVSQADTSVQSRDQFEEWVVQGKVKCQGSGSGGQSAIVDFMNEAVAAHAISEGQLAIGSGVPSPENPSQCIFLITFDVTNSVIIYKDNETGKYIQIPIVK